MTAAPATAPASAAAPAAPTPWRLARRAARMNPSYVQGAYDRDNRFYLDWDPITRDEDAVQAWLREWVYDLDGREAYIEKLGTERLASLKPGPAPSGSVDYGAYR